VSESKESDSLDDVMAMKQITCDSCDNYFFVQDLGINTTVLPCNFCAFCGINFNYKRDDEG